MINVTVSQGRSEAGWPHQVQMCGSLFSASKVGPRTFTAAGARGAVRADRAESAGPELANKHIEQARSRVVPTLSGGPSCSCATR